jgi:hypothetical protein
MDKTVRPLTDTWEYDGETWTRRDTVGVPVFVSSMTYDPRRGQIVLLGVEGMAEQEGVRRTAMWTWDGTRWSSVSSRFGEPALSPMPPLTATPAGLLLMDGGIVQGNTPVTWLWQSDRWTQGKAAPPVPQRVSHALAYDYRRKRVVMFGGHSGFGPGRTGEMFGDTWEWTGEAWERVHPPLHPASADRLKGVRQFSLLPSAFCLVTFSSACPTGSILRSWPASSP